MINLFSTYFEPNIDHSGELVSNYDFSNERMAFGWLPIYPIAMLFGALLVVMCSVIKFRMKKIPLREFEIAIFITLPLGLIAASVFGKLDILNPMQKWWEMFYFWEPGMSLFGGVITGTAVGFVWFYVQSKKTLISVWVYADCILPNLLLAQAIGRWGNLFNHEILGPTTSWDSLSWLPNWIRSKLFYIVDPNGIVDPDTIRIVYRQPLFLYEFIFNLFGFFMLTFIFPNLGRWFSKIKPWDIDEMAFPNRYSKKRQWLKKNELVEYHLQNDVKYIYNARTSNFSLSLWNVWNKAYYLKEVDFFKSDFEDEKIAEYINNHNYKIEQVKKIKAKTKYKIEQNKHKQLNKNKIDIKKLKSLKTEHQEFIKTENAKMKIEIKKIDLKNWFIFNWNFDSSKLEELHNPHKYFIVKCGSITGLYIVWYMLTRIILEAFRGEGEYFIQNAAVLNFVILTLILISGIVVYVFAQFIAPKKWRRAHWLYEKSY
ncbi:prolipoprotein diacylglyceryl transferase [Spiroplasma endosymbiont of Labia minor]|uniref:prolipoprotein diacylglyceryl transferase n=1 Tax=Spiroplasma endosymbiont of Labia minor TaxID=3066305 RepID=UPI0030CE4D80